MRVKRIGKGTDEDPFRPDITGKTYRVIKEYEDGYEVEIEEPKVSGEDIRKLIDYAKSQGWI